MSGLGRRVARCGVVGLVGVVVGLPAMPGVAAASVTPAAHAVPSAVQSVSQPARPAPAQPPSPEPPGAAAAKAAAQAAKRAAQAAQRAAQVRATWVSRDRPHRMAIIRSNRIDVVTDGRLANMSYRSGTVTVPSLDRALPSSWVTIADGTAVLNAAVVLTPGTSFTIGGGGLKTLALQGGGTREDASSIYTGSGRVSMTGVTVTSYDPATKQALPNTSLGRPFVVVSRGGRLETTDATISDLGTPASGLVDGDPAVVYNRGSTGSLTRTTLQRNTTGLELSRSDSVGLDEVTFSESAADGLVLSGDRGTSMKGIRAIGNGDNGVVVTGESTDRLVTGITTSGNGAYGVVVSDQVGTKLSGIATATDQAGGLRVNQSTDIQVSDFSATDQPTGVYTHVSSTRVVLDGIHVNGGRRGVVVEKSTEGLELRNSTIDGSRVAGVAIGGKQIQLTGVEVSDARSGVRIERGASGVRLEDLALHGGRDGVVAVAGTGGIVVADLVAEDVTSDAVRTASSGTEIIGGRIEGGATGIDVAAGTAISGVTISGVGEGIHSRSPEAVRADDVQIDALDVGINSAPGTKFQLTRSSVHALEGLRGDISVTGENDVSLPPLNLLGAIGVPLILLAVVLEQIHVSRQRKVGRHGRRLPPAVPVSAG